MTSTWRTTTGPHSTWSDSGHSLHKSLIRRYLSTQLSTVSCQLTAVSCQLSAVNCQLSAVYSGADHPLVREAILHREPRLQVRLLLPLHPPHRPPHARASRQDIHQVSKMVLVLVLLILLLLLLLLLFLSLPLLLLLLLLLLLITYSNDPRILTYVKKKKILTFFRLLSRVNKLDLCGFYFTEC